MHTIFLPWVSVPSLFRHEPESREPYLRREKKKWEVSTEIFPRQTKAPATVQTLWTYPLFKILTQEPLSYEDILIWIEGLMIKGAVCWWDCKAQSHIVIFCNFRHVQYAFCQVYIAYFPEKYRHMKWCVAAVYWPPSSLPATSRVQCSETPQDARQASSSSGHPASNSTWSSTRRPSRPWTWAWDTPKKKAFLFEPRFPSH